MSPETVGGLRASFAKFFNFNSGHSKLNFWFAEILFFVKIFFSQVESEIQVESSLYFGSVIQVESSVYFGSVTQVESSLTLYFGTVTQVESSLYFGTVIQVDSTLS